MPKDSKQTRSRPHGNQPRIVSVKKPSNDAKNANIQRPATAVKVLKTTVAIEAVTRAASDTVRVRGGETSPRKVEPRTEEVVQRRDKLENDGNSGKTPTTRDVVAGVTSAVVEKHRGQIPPKSIVSRMDGALQRREAARRKESTSKSKT